MFSIDSRLGHVGQFLPSSEQWPQNDWKCWFPTIISKSIHAIHFKLVQTYWVGIQNWSALQPYWPNFGSLLAKKMAENGGFRPLSEKVPLCGFIISGSISNMVFTVVRGVFTNDSLLPHRPNLASLYFHSLWLDLSLGRASSDTLFSYI